MHEDAPVLDGEAIRVLTGIALDAAMGGQAERAVQMLHCLHAIRPDCPNLLLARAIALTCCGDAEAALTLLEKAPSAPADTAAMIAVWRGVALQFAGRQAQAVTVLKTVAGDQGCSGALARLCLEG